MWSVYKVNHSLRKCNAWHSLPLGTTSNTHLIRSGMPLGFSAKSRILLITETLRRTQNKAILCTDEAEEIPDQVRNDYWRHIGRRAGTPLAIYFVEMFVILNISN